jgi:hypothetical protein
MDPGREPKRQTRRELRKACTSSALFFFQVALSSSPNLINRFAFAVNPLEFSPAHFSVSSPWVYNKEEWKS